MESTAARSKRFASVETKLEIPPGTTVTPSEIALPGCAASARSIALSTTGVASKHIRSDEHARRAELQLERQREGLLDRGSGRFRRQPADRHSSDRDVDRDCGGDRIVGRSRTRCDHTGERASRQ